MYNVWACRLFGYVWRPGICVLMTVGNSLCILGDFYSGDHSSRCLILRRDLHLLDVRPKRRYPPGSRRHSRWEHNQNSERLAADILLENACEWTPWRVNFTSLSCGWRRDVTLNRLYAPETPHGATTRRSTSFPSFASSPTRFWGPVHGTCILSTGIRRPEHQSSYGVKNGCCFTPHCSIRLQGTLKFDASLKLISERRF